MEYLVKYSIITIILILLEIIYFPIAKRYRIGCEVSPRSSHNKFVITGGGIIFYISAILFYFLFNPKQLPTSFSIMLIGASILAIISFYDDIKSLAPWMRLIIQIAVVAVTFNQIFFNGYYEIYLLLLICGVGFINAYNFMDGINGILVSYSIVTLSTILYCYLTIVNNIECGIIQFIIPLIISTIIFGVLNFRVNAKCFSGDVGSIVMGFFILYLMAELIIMTTEASLIIFLIVYAIDTVFTIFQRLFAGENIFLPHRLHLYQILVNQWGIKHYIVSIYYAITQLVINIAYLLIPNDFKWSFFILVTTVLTIVYFSLKRSPKSSK